MSYIYGCDGDSTTACSGNTAAFYGGEIGSYQGILSGSGNCGGTSGQYEGPCPGFGGCCFDSSTADAANLNYGTFGYYFIGGPSVDPSWDPSTYTEADAYSWGQKQGQETLDYVEGTGFKYSSYLTVAEVYADIESPVDSYGWLSLSDTYNGVTGEALNHEVFDGWYNAVNGHSTTNLGTMTAGVYSAPDAWSEAMGTKSLSGIPIWTYESQVGCQCPTNMDDAEGFGSGTIKYWQYGHYCGSSGGEDWDMAVTP